MKLKETHDGFGESSPSDNYYGADSSQSDNYYSGGMSTAYEGTNDNGFTYTSPGAHGYDNVTHMASSNAAVSLREQSVLVKSLGFMAVAMLISAISAFATYAYGMRDIYGYLNLITPALVLELIVYFVALFGLNKGNVVVGGIGFVAYSIISGVTMSIIFFAYAMGSIFTIFLITAVMFAGLAVYGYVTKTDLSALQTFFVMGLLGLVGVGIVNIFVGSDMLYNITAVVGVVLFAGITAYDIQRIKSLNRQQESATETTVAMFGGLMLYLDFINIFLKLLRLFAKSRD